MENFSIQHKNIAKNFVGVFPSNYLPNVKFTKFPAYFIINTCTTFDSIFLETIQEIGCHWVCVIVDRFNVIFFDSSAQDFHKTNPHISKFLKIQNKPIITSSVAIQPLESNLCGLYVLVFLSHASKGTSLKSFLSEFQKKPSKVFKNDKIILKMFKKSFINKK